MRGPEGQGSRVAKCCMAFYLFPSAGSQDLRPDRCGDRLCTCCMQSASVSLLGSNESNSCRTKVQLMLYNMMGSRE